jgi:hypothetical protein
MFRRARSAHDGVFRRRAALLDVGRERQVGASPSRCSKSRRRPARSCPPRVLCGGRGISAISGAGRKSTFLLPAFTRPLCASLQLSSSLRMRRLAIGGQFHHLPVHRNEQPGPTRSLSRPRAPTNSQSSRTTSDRTSSPTFAPFSDITLHRVSGSESARSSVRRFSSSATTVAATARARCGGESPDGGLGGRRYGIPSATGGLETMLRRRNSESRRSTLGQ